MSERDCESRVKEDQIFVHAFPKGSIRPYVVDHEQALRDNKELRGRPVRDAIYNFFRIALGYS